MGRSQPESTRRASFCQSRHLVSTVQLCHLDLDSRSNFILKTRPTLQRSAGHQAVRHQRQQVLHQPSSLIGGIINAVVVFARSLRVQTISSTSENARRSILLRRGDCGADGLQEQQGE